MRPTWLNGNASRRNERSAGRKASGLGLAVKGGLASVLALAGLVVFATAASAHDNGLQSVSAVCTAPTSGVGGDGATLTWTLYNDWPLSETGTFSTTQGTLSTTALSIAASPAQNSTPPAAKNQTFTQSLTAPELAALTPSSAITVSWAATWSDAFSATGNLSTTLAALHLPNGCLPQKTSPTIATTLVSPASTTVGNSWSDTATVTGSTGGPAPAGSVAFYVCLASSSTSTCTSDGTHAGTVRSPSSSTGNASTYDLEPTANTPPSAGTYCFYAIYTPTEGEPYLSATGPAECFAVTAPGPNFTVVKTNSPTVGTPVAPGSTIGYTVAVQNVGTAAGSATVTDDVPSSLTVNKMPAPACAVTPPDTCSLANTSGNTWTYTVSLAAGDTATVTYATTVVAAAVTGTTQTVTNTATITDGPCTTSAGCSSTVTNIISAVNTTAAVVTPTATPPATAASTTGPTTSPSTTTALASTGALLTQEWMVGLAALMLGSGLVLLARWRRRIPKHAASRK